MSILKGADIQIRSNHIGRNAGSDNGCSYSYARWVIFLFGLCLTGCDGQQSALSPAGRGAERIADLFWWMSAGAVIIWLFIVGFLFYSVRAHPEAHNNRQTKILIIGGGTVLPTVVLAILLAYGLALLPDLVAPAHKGSLKIAVYGEQWWWRVRYQQADGQAIEVANEIRLPVGVPVEFQLESADVIHSFWIPSIGGKVDMFPGRQTRLFLEPTRTGIFRGVCAEYCGASHALMSFPVMVLEREEFSLWLEQESKPAQMPSEPLAARGQQVFLAQGCNACHTIRGTPAKGVIGPDLTHIGNRMSLGAGTLSNEVESLKRWIAHTDGVKPGVLMPEFRMLSQEELEALASYLSGLK
jgi:cytochrome c oxidase subunit 2